jgi:lipoate-protein ligase B
LIGSVVAEWSGGGLEPEYREGATGVWVRRAVGAAGECDGAKKVTSSHHDAKKIASMGIAVRKWVTYHGLALNAVCSLEGFGLISPCGFSPEVMTRLVDGIAPTSEFARVLGEWDNRGRAMLEHAIARRWMGHSAENAAVTGGSIDSDILQLSIAEARARIEAEARSVGKSG